MFLLINEDFMQPASERSFWHPPLVWKKSVKNTLESGALEKSLDKFLPAVPSKSINT